MADATKAEVLFFEAISSANLLYRLRCLFCECEVCSKALPGARKGS